MSKRAKIIYLSLSAIFLFVTLGCIYYLMGGIISGVNNLRVYKQDGIVRNLAGQPYEGEPKSKELTRLFERYRNWIKMDFENALVKDKITKLKKIDNSKRQFNFLSIVNYPTGSNKSVNHFIGVAIRGSSGMLPMGDEDIKEISCQIRYTVFLTMHPVVRPPTHKIEQMIRDQAVADGQEIAFFYETYYTDNSMRIEGFVD